MASIETQENQQTQEQPQPLIADENTMTVWGETVGTALGNNRVAFEGLQNELKAEKAKVSDLEATIEGKDTEIEMLAGQLKAAKERAALLAIAPVAFQKKADGSISFQVTLDADAAMPLLSQAEGAGEDPATYISKLVGESIIAYACS
jgi:hypothetical protein